MTPKTILVPIDFSQASERALDYACALAAKLDAKVHLVNAIGAGLPELNMTLSDAMFESLREGNRAQLASYADPRRALCAIGELVIEDGDPREAIVEVAEKLHADLVIMGTHGRRGLARMILGSVAEDVSRRAPCPVLLVRAHKGEP